MKQCVKVDYLWMGAILSVKTRLSLSPAKYTRVGASKGLVPFTKMG